MTHRNTTLAGSATLFLSLLAAPPAQIIGPDSGPIAGKFERPLAAKLGTLAPWQQVPALIVLREQMDLRQIQKRLNQGNATRWLRHYTICDTAQKIANAIQGPVLAKLARSQQNGQASQIQPAWIVNAIGVHATAAALLEVANDPAVKHIEDGSIAIELIQPVDSTPEQGGTPAAPEPGLLDIKADFLWNLGFLGQGRIVSNLDTGVLLGHPALSARWRGRDAGVPASAAWHSPRLMRPLPTDSNSHGTHTMGTMCGDDGGANRIGVAPAAKWIASDAIAGTIAQVRIEAILAFQWSADPDGNPTTVNDVPDSSCNSWRLSPFFHGVGRCDATFWAAIDVCDAAGCAVIFAAGNEGTSNGGTANLGTPSDRTTTEFNCFSVGALLAGSTVVTSYSSRGPSGCPGAAIKPEVSARGDQVRSSVLNNGYGSLSGTSMATPHVTGAVALLRQVEPNLSSEQVKRLLMETADDLGATGPDNIYGSGRINLQRAYNKILADRATAQGISVGIATTTQTVRLGNNLNYFVNLINHNSSTSNVNIVVELTILDLSATGTVIGPTPAAIPGGFNLDPSWPMLVFGIPAALPPVFLTYNYRLTFKALDTSNNLLSSASVDFKIAP